LLRDAALDGRFGSLNGLGQFIDPFPLFFFFIIIAGPFSGCIGTAV
jgi:hypothetical protein